MTNFELSLPFIFWILMNLANIFDAMGDAFMKNSKWFLSKTFQMLMVLSLCAMIPLAIFMPPEFTTWPCWLYFALMYMFIRVGVFNVVWAMVKFGRVNKKFYWYYLGGTSLWDRFLEWIITKGGFPQKTFLRLFYIIFWIVSIGVLTNGFYLIPE